MLDEHQDRGHRSLLSQDSSNAGPLGPLRVVDAEMAVSGGSGNERGQSQRGPGLGADHERPTRTQHRDEWTGHERAWRWGWPRPTGIPGRPRWPAQPGYGFPFT